jgi:hypothetical protein
MVELFLTLVRILFPLDPVTRLREITRHNLGELVDRLEDDACLHELLTDQHAAPSSKPRSPPPKTASTC